MRLNPITGEIQDDYIGFPLGNQLYRVQEPDFTYKITDEAGTAISDERFSWLWPHNDGAIAFTQKTGTDTLNGYLKIINRSIKKTLISTKNNHITNTVSENKVFACPPLEASKIEGQYREKTFYFQSGACGYFDTDGNAVTDPIYLFGTPFRKGKATACKRHISDNEIECVWLNQNGRVLSSRRFTHAGIAEWLPADDRVFILARTDKSDPSVYIFFYPDGRTREFPSKPVAKTPRE